MAVTMSLTIIAGAMKKQKVLCKSLSTVETLGSINVLCSDKTGTLTENVMRVTNAAIHTQEKSPEEARRLVETGPNASNNPWTQLWHVAGLCCSAIFDAETIDRALAERRILGDATDQATLRFAETIGSVDALKSVWKQIAEVPFNSKNKVLHFHMLNTNSKFMLRIFEAKDLKTAGKALSRDEMSQYFSTDRISITGPSKYSGHVYQGSTGHPSSPLYICHIT